MREPLGKCYRPLLSITDDLMIRYNTHFFVASFGFAVAAVAVAATVDVAFAASFAISMVQTIKFKQIK